MSAAPKPLGPARQERALDRLHRHCELVGGMTAVEVRRIVVRARLERKLGPELTRTLLSELVSDAA
jgi:hypothetical protein